jgi:hypothetical protein
VKIWIAFCLSLPNLLVAQKQISNETAPPGGWAQIKISLSKPRAVANGAIAMNFDPTVFGPAANCTVFSANGDAWGTTDCKLTMFAGGPDSEISGEELKISIPSLPARLPESAGCETSHFLLSTFRYCRPLRRARPSP